MMKKVLTSYSTLVKGKVNIILCTGNVFIINNVQKNKLKEFIQIMGDRFDIDSEPVDCIINE